MESSCCQGARRHSPKQRVDAGEMWKAVGIRPRTDCERTDPRSGYEAGAITRRQAGVPRRHVEDFAFHFYWRAREYAFDADKELAIIAHMEKRMPRFPFGSLSVGSTESNAALELLTVADMAELLKISVSGVRRLQQARHLPFVKVGGSVRFYKSDVVAYLQKRRVEAIGR